MGLIDGRVEFFLLTTAHGADKVGHVPSATVTTKLLYLLVVLVINPAATTATFERTAFVLQNDACFHTVESGAISFARVNGHVAHFEEDRDITPLKGRKLHIGCFTSIVPAKASAESVH